MINIYEEDQVSSLIEYFALEEYEKLPKHIVLQRNIRMIRRGQQEVWKMDLRIRYRARKNDTLRRNIRNLFLVSFKTKSFRDQKPLKMLSGDLKWIYIVTKRI
jgi:hypothetical protein